MKIERVEVRVTELPVRLKRTFSSGSEGRAVSSKRRRSLLRVMVANGPPSGLNSAHRSASSSESVSSEGAPDSPVPRALTPPPG